MKIEVYTRESCHYCQLTKKFLELRNLPYTSHQIDVDLTVEEVKEMFPDAKTVPIILVDGKYIPGGYTEFVTLF